MSETAKTRSRKSATKPALEGSDQQTVAENTPVPAAQAEPEQVANPEPPQAMPEPQASADEQKSEQNAQMTGSQTDRQLPEVNVNAPMPQVKTPKGTVLGAFLVSAKSEQGFWRAGIKFERSKKTLLVVCELGIESGVTVDASDVEFDEMLFVDKSSAERIYREPNLSVKAIDL
ncbi:TPA: hypothetical protein ACGG72_002814 [Vibrio cholerae]